MLLWVLSTSTYLTIEVISTLIPGFFILFENFLWCVSYVYLSTKQVEHNVAIVQYISSPNTRVRSSIVKGVVNP